MRVLLFLLPLVAALALFSEPRAAEPASWHAPSAVSVDGNILSDPNSTEEERLFAAFRAGQRAERIERVELTSLPTSPDGRAVVPWGDLLGEIISALGLVVAGIVAWVLRKLPASVVSALDAAAGIFNQGRANELLEKAVKYGINVTKGAVEGKTLTLEIGNEVLERAVEYALSKAPFFIRMVLGGENNLRSMVVARLALDEQAALPAARPVADRLVAERVEAPAA